MKYLLPSRPLLSPKTALLAGAVLLTLAGFSLFGGQQASAITVPVPTLVAADKADACEQKAGGFLGLESWYHFMPKELGVPKHGDTPADPCGVRCFNVFVQAQPNDCGQTQSDIPGVILAIIDDLLRIAGLAAVIYILVGAFQYVGSRGNSERTAAAQSTIISALIGLAIALVAVAFVSFLGNRLS